MAHAILSASGSSRWLACPPSARLEEKEPDKTSIHAEEGTLAHEVCELMVRYNAGEIKKPTYTRRLNKLKKHKLFANDMIDYCTTYAEIVREKYLTAKKHTPDVQLRVEQRLDFSNIVPDGFGTVDALIIADGIIEVIDFKYGKGVEVSAVDNSQMKLYGLGAINEYEMLYDIQEVHLSIVQPRLDNFSEFIITLDDLCQWGDEVKGIAEVAYKGEGEFKAGKHCTFCKVKAKCKAQAEEQLEIAKYDFKDSTFLTDEDISDILARSAGLKKWLKAVEEYALDQAVNHGQNYPGYKIVAGRSTRQFTDQDKVKETLLLEGFEEPLIYKPKEMLGITALEKLVGKKEFSSILGNLIIKPEGKPTLVPESDKRLALNSIEEAKRDFQ